MAATTTLRHRGPDDEGFLLASSRTRAARPFGGADTDPALGLPDVRSADEPADLVLGFRRLAIVDLSPAGHQPMSSRDGRLWMVFNGEIYNYRELRDELTALGHEFRGHSDSEVLLAAYAEWGADCLRRFNGMWGVAIWDVARSELFIARDRFGVKPVFYSLEDGCLRFASEIKALVGPHGVPFRPRDAAVHAFLHDGALPSATRGDTFFENVRALPPGHLMRVTAGDVRVERYYELPAAPAANGAGAAAHGQRPTRDDVVAGFRDLFTDAVRLRLHADVPVGTCLSGGVDSSSIVCTARQLVLDDPEVRHDVGRRIKTFSAVYGTDAPYDESEYIAMVAEATGADAHRTVPTLDRLHEDVKRVVFHQDEPFGGLSIFAQWCVMAKVRESGVTVLLDGQGADEQMAGYQPYEIHFGELLRRGRVLEAIGAARAATTIVGPASWPRFRAAAIGQLPLPVLRALRARGARRLAASGRALDPMAEALYTDGRQEFERSDEDDFSLLRKSLDEHLRDSLTETSLPHLLRYEDRNSMAFSVEARVPFVDYRLIEYTTVAGRDYRIVDGWSKWLLRAAVDGRVPHEITWRRRKVGFDVPESDWVRGLLERLPADWHEPARRYFDGRAFTPEAVEGWLSQGLARRLWRFVNVAIWMEAFGGA